MSGQKKKWIEERRNFEQGQNDPCNMHTWTGNKFWKSMARKKQFW